MVDHAPSADEVVAIHLLDSAQGHPIQTWRFAGKSAVTIGRSPENDVAIADQHVSRLHARLVWQGGQWTLVSVGRHGTLVNDRVIAEAVLGEQTVFRLGAGGPLLRFQCGEGEERPTETIGAIPADLLAMLGVDESRKQQEVDQISNDALFQQIQQQARRLKQDSPLDPLAETEIP